MAKALTARQKQVLDVIRAAVDERGYPPSVREIGQAVGLRSTSSVHNQLLTLERNGYLRRDPTRPRALEVRYDPDTELSMPTAPTRQVPLVGEIAAGAPVVAEENVEDLYVLPKDLVGDGTLFMLRVRGESMIDAGVHPGDMVVIRRQSEVTQGEMCAALIDDEATVKYFRRTKDGEIFLDPANERYEPIPLSSENTNAVIGKVVSVLRRL
ncbi:MAG: transcriptional repressor LexA [Egibacteraceae bacterium]